MTTFIWLNAQRQCNTLTTGSRLGWRLPTIQELASLVDPSVPVPGFTLPSGHPFSNVRASDYCSATTSALDTGLAWLVSFLAGGAGADNKSNSPLRVVCARAADRVLILSDLVI